MWRTATLDSPDYPTRGTAHYMHATYRGPPHKNGSSASFSRQSWAKESMPFLPSTGSIATSTRICGVIWIIVLARHAATPPNPAACWSCSGCAAWGRAPTQTPLRTRPCSLVRHRSVPGIELAPSSGFAWGLHPTRSSVFSACSSPAAANVRPRIFRGAGPAPLPIATSTQGASFVVGALNETVGAEPEALRWILKQGSFAWA
jgi:hypothetical protein